MNELVVKQSILLILNLVDEAIGKKKGERVRSQVSYPARARCFAAAALLAELLSELPHGVACKLSLQAWEGFILEVGEPQLSEPLMDLNELGLCGKRVFPIIILH